MNKERINLILQVLEKQDESITNIKKQRSTFNIF